MMVTLGIWLRRWQRQLRKIVLEPRIQAMAQAAGYVLCGFLLAAASLGNYPQPFAVALVCCLGGWPGVLAAAGAAVGYPVFWGMAGAEGIAWLCAALPASLLLGSRRELGLLMPALAGLFVAAAGLAFEFWAKAGVPMGMYLLRILLAMGAVWLFHKAEGRDPVIDWALEGVAVLALAQVVPIPYLGLGYIAGGLLTVGSAFPAAALAGLALDLAQITPVPMTAVLSLAWVLRLIPGLKKWMLWASPGFVYLLVMGLSGVWDLQPVPALLLGGGLSLLLPARTSYARRRGETGKAQVQLEMAASVLRQTQQLLMDVESHPIDEVALIARAADRACGSCPCRSKCKQKPENLPVGLLRKPLGNGEDLPLDCRKSGRLLAELRRSQEQLRSIRADRDRQEEYRAAVVQQYGFLSDYLQSVSDALASRNQLLKPQYQPRIALRCGSREDISGDRCLYFAGVECRYYVLICDGMGTGQEAARAGRRVAGMLRELLGAGYPPEYALRSVNSLCALQGQAGLVTVDLAELRLDTGKAVLYKWGAAPSYVVSRGEAVKVGTAAPPPGLSVTEGRETVERVSLRRGEMLVLLSDGAEGESSVRPVLESFPDSPGELAGRILERSRWRGTDDATVAVVCLQEVPPS